jgi:hypothetical protein
MDKAARRRGFNREERASAENDGSPAPHREMALAAVAGGRHL